MKLEGQYGWFKDKEKAGLRVLQRHYPKLGTHVTQERGTYDRYMKVLCEIPKRFDMKRSPVRELLLIASIFILRRDSKIVDLIAEYEVKGDPQTLTNALSLFDLHVDGFGIIDDTYKKVLFLLLAGLVSEEI